MNEIAEHAARMRSLLGLASEPVAVFLLQNEAEPFAQWEHVQRHRYCQAVMRARRGERIVLTKDELSCPAAAAAFGFRPLPDQLASGNGLVGFGIVQEPGTGRTMFDTMPRLKSGDVETIALCPLAASPRRPEVVILEGRPEPLMWVLLADLNLAGGSRRRASTAVLQATCVDATIIPHLEERLNFSLGCYGCREATDLDKSETVLGFPGSMLEGLVDAVQALSAKAMPRSRAKPSYEQLQRRLDTPGEAAPESSSSNRCEDGSSANQRIPSKQKGRDHD